jgi:hypothetical protein
MAIGRWWHVVPRARHRLPQGMTRKRAQGPGELRGGARKARRRAFYTAVQARRAHFGEETEALEVTFCMLWCCNAAQSMVRADFYWGANWSFGVHCTAQRTL